MIKYVVTKDERKCIMMKSKTLNMTHGNPTKLLIIFAVPMLIGNIFQQMYNLVDSVIVGKFVGADALAAIGATNSVSFLFFSLCNGIGSGGGIVTAQQFGTGHEENTKKSIINAGYIMIIGSLVMGAVAFVASKGVLQFMETPEEIMQDAILYMQMQCVGLPLIAVYNHSSSMLRALGDSRTPLYFLIFASILNVGLDLWFVCGLEMGVFGAALATIIAQFVAGIGCLIYAVKFNSYFHFEKRHFKPEKSLIWGAVRMGVPLSLQFSLVAISCMGLQRVVNSFGAVVIAAFTAVSRVEQLLHQPYGTLSAALSTYSGQNLGANRIDRIKLGFQKSMIMMTIFSFVMLPVMQFGGEAIISLFVNDTEVIYFGALAMKITSWFYFFLGTINIIRGVLNGIGDAAFALINGVVEVVVRVTLPIVLTGTAVLGVLGIWWAAGLTWMISAFFCWLRYVSWKRKLKIV